MPEIATVLGVAKSTVWYILRKKESTGELSNAKRPGASFINVAYAQKKAYATLYAIVEIYKKQT